MLWHYSTVMPFFVPFVCTYAGTHKILVSPVTSVGGLCPCALTWQEAFMFLPVQMCMHLSFDKVPLDDGKANKGDLKWSVWWDKSRSRSSRRVPSSSREGKSSSRSSRFCTPCTCSADLSVSDNTKSNQTSLCI